MKFWNINLVTFPFCSLNWINSTLYRRRRSKFSELVPNPFAERSCNKICSNQLTGCDPAMWWKIRNFRALSNCTAIRQSDPDCVQLSCHSIVNTWMCMGKWWSCSAHTKCKKEKELQNNKTVHLSLCMWFYVTLY